MADNGKQNVHDSLVVSIGAAIMQGLVMRPNAQTAALTIDSREVARLVTESVRAIEATEEYAEEKAMLKEVDGLIEALDALKKEGKRRDIVALGMMKVSHIAQMRSPTLTHEALLIALNFGQVSPAAVNSEHVETMMQTFAKFRDLLRASLESGPKFTPSAKES